MHLALLTTSYPSTEDDAAGHFVRQEALELLKAHQVSVLAPEHSSAQRPRSPRVYELPHLGLFGWPGALARLRARPARLLGLVPFGVSALARLRQLSPERVVAHWLVPCGWPLGWLARRRSGCSLEVVVHGSDVTLLEALPRPISHLVISSLHASGAELRSVSAELVERLAEIAPGSAEGWILGARIAPAAIDLSRAPSRAEARRRLDVRGALIVIVSRLVPQKRVEVALEAAALTEASCVVVGDGPDLDSLRQRFPGAQFVGHVPRDEALAWLAAADLLLCASKREGAPTVVREARGLGVPVVALAAGDLEEWARSDPGLWVLSASSDRLGPNSRQ